MGYWGAARARVAAVAARGTAAFDDRRAELLGQQVMFLTIGDDGSIQSCRVVGTSGDMLPAYGCAEAKTEQFRVAASASSDAPRQAFMSIRVYGHQEQIV